MVGHNRDLNERFEQLPLSPQAGLLFPGEDAKILTELPASELPNELIVPDGTWHHVPNEDFGQRGFSDVNYII